MSKIVCVLCQQISQPYSGVGGWVGFRSGKIGRGWGANIEAVYQNVYQVKKESPEAY